MSGARALPAGGWSLPARAALTAVLALCSLAAGCPLRQSDRAPGVEAWTEEIRLRVGESGEVDGGALAVTLQSLDYGNRISNLTIRMAASDGRSLVGTIRAVRNTQLSEAIRLEPYAVRVVEYPGVDSALLQVTREQPDRGVE